VSFDGKWGYIDKLGTVMIKPQFSSVRTFSEGLAAVRIGDYFSGKDGYIDKQGMVVIEPLRRRVPVLGAGRRAHRRQIRLHRQGRKIVIPPRFDFADTFGDGWPRSAPATRRPAIRLHRQEGKIVIRPQYDFADLFSRRTDWPRCASATIRPGSTAISQV